MTSFYGGPVGLGLDIKTTFSSIDEMAGYFQEGDSYTTVWYGECAIINGDINNADNGKIYRRTKTYPGYLFITQLGFLGGTNPVPINTALIGIYNTIVQEEGGEEVTSHTYTSIIQPVYHRITIPNTSEPGE